jgi:WD40-like Beta Propeller Repeat/Lipoprotein LpqB beta-propeller domain
VALDERLRRELEEAGRPADTSGVYEELIRRHERRRVLRRVEMGLLAVAVVAGTVGGIFALSRVISSGDPSVEIAPSPLASGDLAYTDGERILIQAPDGSEPRTIPQPAPGIAWHVAWSPDGRKLAVTVFDGPRRSLWVMRADGSAPVRIAEGDNVGRPSWHPDGVHIAYRLDGDGRTEVHITRSDGTGDRLVYSRAAPGTFAVFSATFSPDGSQLVFDAGTDTGYSIFLMEADGANVRRITDTGTDYNPSWSPDGARLIFTREEAVGGSDIFVMDADGSNVHRITDDDPSITNLDAQFTPDGSLITYTSATNGGTGRVVMMNPDGSGARTLIEDAVLGFSWQPLSESGNLNPPSPAPTGATDPARGEDIGLGFPVCNVSSIDGHFVSPDARATVFVATRVGDTGGCPQPDEGFNVAALDIDRDGLAESSFGPIECEFECRTFSAPDINRDGTDELLVVQGGGAVVRAHLYDIASTATDPSIVPLLLAAPGDPEGGLDPGQQTTFLIGGDAFELYGVQCGEVPGPDGPGVISTRAESLPHDALDATWHAHQTTLVWREDGVMHVVDVRDFTEPVTDDPAGPSFLSGETLCGSNLGP